MFLTGKWVHLSTALSSYARPFTTTAISNAHKDLKRVSRLITRPDDGTQSLEVDDLKKFQRVCEFPDYETEKRVFNGIQYSDIPILHIKATPNNTKLTVVKPDNQTVLMQRSCGYDGFKNCRKGTNVAAHTTGLVLGKKLQLKGVRTVKLGIKGIGPGRMASVQGLVQSGLNIVSITDETKIEKYPPRPPLPRRL